jgi:hypothetical protein
MHNQMMNIKIGLTVIATRFLHTNTSYWFPNLYSVINAINLLPKNEFDNTKSYCFLFGVELVLDTLHQMYDQFHSEHGEHRSVRSFHDDRIFVHDFISPSWCWSRRGAKVRVHPHDFIHRLVRTMHVI